MYVNLFDFHTGNDLLYTEYLRFDDQEAFAVLQDRMNGKKFSPVSRSPASKIIIEKLQAKAS
jgi:hypothetical protein